MDAAQIEARKRAAKAMFGRDLTTEQVIAFDARLDAAVRNVTILTEWETRLGLTEPAAVHHVTDKKHHDR